MKFCKYLVLLLGQIPSLSTILLPSLLFFCFNARGRFFLCLFTISQVHQGKTEEEELSKPSPSGPRRVLILLSQVCLRSIQVAKHLEKNYEVEMLSM